ncbi:MAG: glycine zipper 2TM domain-containing protein, partial [Candidatus Dadabacteria bacterium]
MKQSWLRLFIISALFLFLSACAGSQPITTREKTTLGGTALGAGVGAIIGSQRGDAVEGAVIGGAIGALSGALAGNQLQKQE